MAKSLRAVYVKRWLDETQSADGWSRWFDAYIKHHGVWRKADDIYIKYLGEWWLVHDPDSVRVLTYYIDEDTTALSLFQWATSHPDNLGRIWTSKDLAGIPFRIQFYISAKVAGTNHNGPVTVDGSFHAGTTIQLYNYGNIYGYAGKGGPALTPYHAGGKTYFNNVDYAEGKDGGDAIRNYGRLSIYNYGKIYAGGGGGHGGVPHLQVEASEDVNVSFDWRQMYGWFVAPATRGTHGWCGCGGWRSSCGANSWHWPVDPYEGKPCYYEHYGGGFSGSPHYHSARKVGFPKTWMIMECSPGSYFEPGSYYGICPLAQYWIDQAGGYIPWGQRYPLAISKGVKGTAFHGANGGGGAGLNSEAGDYHNVMKPLDGYGHTGSANTWGVIRSILICVAKGISGAGGGDAAVLAAIKQYEGVGNFSANSVTKSPSGHYILNWTLPGRFLVKMAYMYYWSRVWHHVVENVPAHNLRVSASEDTSGFNVNYYLKGDVGSTPRQMSVTYGTAGSLLEGGSGGKTTLAGKSNYGFSWMDLWDGSAGDGGDAGENGESVTIPTATIGSNTCGGVTILGGEGGGTVNSKVGASVTVVVEGDMKGPLKSSL
jgi:hypothetical protein